MPSYPYISSSGPIVQIVTHLRKSFPALVDAATLKKLGIASNNESYLINILRFLKIIDDEGKRIEAAQKVFVIHDDKQFQSKFGELVKAAYKELFDLHASDTWTIDANALITFFRQADDSSALVGSRQANTFNALRALAGHGEISSPRVSEKKTSSGTKKEKPLKAEKVQHAAPEIKINGQQNLPIGLTVRIEINLPTAGDQTTYDNIFQSIRKNLIDGK